MGRLCSDKLSGPRVRLALGRFLPDAICDAFRDAPSDSIRLLEFNQENPELVWDTESRKHVAEIVATLSRRFVISLIYVFYTLCCHIII